MTISILSLVCTPKIKQFYHHNPLYFRTVDPKFYKIRVGEHDLRVAEGSEKTYDVASIILVS